MCQAYEWEVKMIRLMEDEATEKGFKDATEEKPKQNPFHETYEMYEHKAYEHGYNCYAAKIVPWAIVKHLK